MNENKEIHPLLLHLGDQAYSKYEDTSFIVDQQYADDVGRASTAQHTIESLEKPIKDPAHLPTEITGPKKIAMIYEPSLNTLAVIYEQQNT